MTDAERWMTEAIRLARRGEGGVNPNPLVGALVVRGDEVVGRGFHEAFGGPHAEPLALDDAGEAAQGATLVVNLEPCAHHGKTPPCTERIIAAGIRRVLVGCRDPHPLVNGAGVAALAAAGIDVVEGVLEEEARRLNEVFFTYVTTGRPFVHLKLASSLDGRIASSSGRARWISGEASRRAAHVMRRRYMALAVGVGTVIIDDPRLTVRHVTGRQPRRFVLDGSGRTPPGARLLGDGGATTVITAEMSPERQRELERRGATVWRLPGSHGRIDPLAVLRRMAEGGIDSLLLEGGKSTATEFLRAGLVDKLSVFVAPLLLGADGVPAVGALDVEAPADGIRLRDVLVTAVGDDALIEGYPTRPPDHAAGLAGGAHGEIS